MSYGFHNFSEVLLLESCVFYSRGWDLFFCSALLSHPRGGDFQKLQISELRIFILFQNLFLDALLGKLRFPDSIPKRRVRRSCGGGEGGQFKDAAREAKFLQGGGGGEASNAGRLGILFAPDSSSPDPPPSLPLGQHGSPMVPVLRGFVIIFIWCISSFPDSEGGNPSETG